MGKTFVLACDGGGVRGYITARVLQRLAGSSGAGDFLSRVSLNAGTSTGGFISLALAAGVPVEMILTQYEQAHAARMFTPNPELSRVVSRRRATTLEAIRARAASLGGIWDDLLKYFEYFAGAAYTHEGVTAVAQRLLGEHTTLDQLRPVLINTLQLDDTSATLAGWTPLAISNTAGERYTGMAAWEAALCAGAAPIYFPPFKARSVKLGYCADGGLFAANPSVSAIVHARSQGVAPDDLYVLSLDTGTTGDATPHTERWSAPQVPFARTAAELTLPKAPMVSALMDSSATAIAQHAARILGSRYFRVSVPLTGEVALDDTSPAAYATMDASLARYFASPGFAAAVTWLETRVPGGPG
jgi:patatin-like phospholipase/acyl hydrolase